MDIETDLDVIATYAETHCNENEYFRDFLDNRDSKDIDTLVHQLNDVVSAAIDCTDCGNCCRAFMINVSNKEAEDLSLQLDIPLSQLKQSHLEESMYGQFVIKSIPCSFLTGNRCSIYEHRFNSCREFPHLHQPNLISRLFSILAYYGTCPIIFNVIEALKVQTGFKETEI